MKTIVLVNQKGGVGKTTFADEIAWGLERRGREVGFINLDPQGGASHEQKTVEGEKAVTVVDTPGYLNDKLGGYAADFIACHGSAWRGLRLKSKPSPAKNARRRCVPPYPATRTLGHKSASGHSSHLGLRASQISRPKVIH